MNAVSDTSPLNYSALIGCVRVLPSLFTSVSVPSSVRQELEHSETPEKVRDWLASSPPWLSTHPVPSIAEAGLAQLDDGERDVILLAEAFRTDILLMDERAGTAAARARGLAATGTLGLLDRAARRGLLDLSQAVARLQETSFRCRPALLLNLLSRRGEA